jgi:YidC/Oxa1 family membrane protein insertase
MWTSFVELIRITIFATAHLCGSLGGAIVLASFVVRLALLPLTLRLARHALAQQRKMLALRPQLERLQKRWASDPMRLFQETQALQRRHGIRPFTPTSLVSMAVQIPLLGGLFSAVRTGLGARVSFLWVADLARGDGLLTMIVVAMSAAAAWCSPTLGTPEATTMLMVVVGLGTLVVLWSASSAVALSVGGGAIVSAIQALIVRRDLRRAEV